MIKVVMSFFGINGSKKTQKNSAKSTKTSMELFELKTEGRPVIRGGRLVSNKKRYTRNDKVKASLAL